MPIATTDLVLRYLVEEWHTRVPNLASYLHEYFGYSVPRPLHIERLFICEQADGSVANENIGGLFAAKWIVTESGTQAVPLDYAWKEMYATDESGEVYVSPSFLFCYENDMILLSERYGAGLRRRFKGKVIEDGPKPVIDWSVLWTTGT